MPPQHICPLCSKVFTKKSTYDYHINRKNKCNQEVIIQCDYCQRVFANRYNLKIHLDDDRCKEYRKLERELFKQLQNKVDVLEDKYDELLQVQRATVSASSLTNNNTNNTNNGTINNNSGTINNNNVTVNQQVNQEVKVVVFGEEDQNEIISALTEQDKERICQAGEKCVIEAVRTVHNNDKLPQYKNVINTNVRANYCLVQTDDGMQRVPKKNVMESLISMRGRTVKRILDNPPKSVHKSDLEDAEDEVAKVYRGSRMYDEKHHHERAKEAELVVASKDERKQLSC